MGAGRALWASLHLLDRQLIDRDGLPAGKVDDLDFALTDEPDALPVLTTILCGQAALAARFSPHARRAAEHLRRVHEPADEPGPGGIPAGAIREIGAAVTLSIARRDVPTNATEDFLSRHVITHLPGGRRHASQ